MPGSYKKRGPNTYLLTICHGYDNKGKQVRHFRTVHVDSDAKAERQLALFYASVVEGSVKPKKATLTFSEFVEYWRENYGAKPRHLSRKTFERYNELLNSRIIPAFRHIRLDEIQPGHILRFISDLEKPGIRLDGKGGNLSPRLVEMHFRLLSAMFNKAIKWKLLGENPCSGVDAPKVEYGDEAVAIYDKQTLGQFLVALDSDTKVKTKYRVLVYLALITGMRRGELLGLEWSAIDMARKQVHVRQASEYIVGEPLAVKGPKTKGSKRWLSISDVVVSLLEQLKLEQTDQRKKKGSRWIESDRVFTRTNGGPMHVNSFHTWLSKFTTANGLPSIAPHAFRHMSATYKLEEGASVKAVQGDLGHARLNTTNRYTHRLESAARDAAERISSFVSRLKEEAAATDDSNA